ncbi:uncharacterized protein M8220_002493 [Acridotheres tristis]
MPVPMPPTPPLGTSSRLRRRCPSRLELRRRDPPRGIISSTPRWVSPPRGTGASPGSPVRITDAHRRVTTPPAGSAHKHQHTDFLAALPGRPTPPRDLDSTSPPIITPARRTSRGPPYLSACTWPGWAIVEAASAEAKLRGWSCRSRAGKKRSSQLEKEVATLSEKIHHLDDMLKSQQRKVRHMIEQLQNSKSVIQKKQAELQELQELVSYLEDENLEMHDRIEHLIEAQQTSPGPKAAASDPSGGNRNFGNSPEFPLPTPKIPEKFHFVPQNSMIFPPKFHHFPTEFHDSPPQNSMNSPQNFHYFFPKIPWFFHLIPCFSC